MAHVNAVRGLAKVKKYKGVGSGVKCGLKAHRRYSRVRKLQRATGIRDNVSKFRAVIVFKVVTIYTSLMV